jgi:hypothetical protein
MGLRVTGFVRKGVEKVRGGAVTWQGWWSVANSRSMPVLLLQQSRDQPINSTSSRQDLTAASGLRAGDRKPKNGIAGWAIGILTTTPGVACKLCFRLHGQARHFRSRNQSGDLVSGLGTGQQRLARLVGNQLK